MHGMHFQHSGAKIRVFEQNTDIIKFWLYYSVTAHDHSIFFYFKTSRTFLFKLHFTFLIHALNVVKT